jgi:hypothetical protein
MNVPAPGFVAFWTLQVWFLLTGSRLLQKSLVIECHPPKALGGRFDSVEKPMKPDQKKDHKKDEKKKGKVKTKLTSKELTEGELDKVQGGIARNAKPL